MTVLKGVGHLNDDPLTVALRATKAIKHWSTNPLHFYHLTADLAGRVCVETNGSAHPSEFIATFNYASDPEWLAENVLAVRQERNSKGYAPGRPRLDNGPLRAKALELVANGMKPEVAAREVGVCGTSVRRWVKEAKRVESETE